MNFNSETWKKFDARVNVNHRCEFTRVSSCASQPGVFQFRAEMFVRRADKIIQENSREERERERESSLSISKYRKSWRVASKKRRSKTFFYRGDKRLPRQAANPSPPDFVCTHERHTYTRIIIARFIEARSRENLCTGSASFTLT